MITMASNFQQGRYTVKNVDKYMGDPNKVVFRSSWELDLHKFFDNNPNVVRWGSEIIAIPYIKPTDGRIHKYFVDYYVEYINTSGQLIKELIELKPKSQTVPPKGKRKSILYEQLQYAVNVAKWAAATEWCNSRGIKFRIVTERSVFR